MAVIGQILVQFVFRLSFGMALAMAVTPARLVTSGFYRVHLWVLMGLNTLAALAVYSGRASESAIVDWPIRLAMAVLLALLSYVGAVMWLYEKKRAGQILLWLISIGGLTAAAISLPPMALQSAGSGALHAADLVTSGLLMGTTLAAMLLGHWYLNTPSMQLVPLQRLIGLMFGAGVLRAIVAIGGLLLLRSAGAETAELFVAFLTFRWIAGIGGPLLMAQMARQTLKIPNTQSATGILYAGVILVFLGELTSQLLSVDARLPL